MYLLGDIGVLADHLSGSIDSTRSEVLLSEYDRKVYVIAPKTLVKIRGILFTPWVIARFYQPRWNATGLKIFEDWKSAVVETGAEVMEAG